MKYIQKVGKEIGLLLFCFLIMILLSSLYLLKDHQNIVNVIPEWNDEHFYYNQIMAMLKYGRPLGYYGYEGSHALFGNYGAHGFMILVPYALFALFAGFRYNTIAIVNHFLFAIAIYVYWKLLKPSWLKLIT